tara:strand:+ start:1615 stop:3711 length:2097 start_codon:yes stop_codon:yes gene_type:complete
MENQKPWTIENENDISENVKPWTLTDGALQGNAPVKSQLGRSFMQGLTDYTADEAEALIVSNLPDSITGNPQTYQQARDKIRNDLAVYKQANGGKAFGMEMFGAITQGVITAFATKNPRAVVDGPMKTFLRNTAVRNAQQGARAGLGESEADLMEGDFAGVATDTGKGAGYGIALGVPMEKAMNVAGGAISKYGGEFAEKFTRKGKSIKKLSEQLGVSQGAANIIYTMIAHGMNLQQMTANLRKAGDQGMIIDADKSIAQLGDAIQASGLPNAGRIIGNAADTRAANQADELRPTMDEVLGEAPEGLETAVDAVASRTAKGREEAYNEAYALPIDYASGAGLRIERIMDDLARNAPRDFRAAIQSANLNMAADGKENMQFLAEELADGTFKIKQMPNLIQLDYLKQALQATYDRTGDIGYKKFSEQLRDAGVEAVPQYGKALQLGQEKIVETEVMQMGAKFLQDNVKLDQLKKSVAAASDVEMDAMRLGARNQIEEILDQTRKNIGSVGDDKAGATAEESRKLLRILSSDSSRKKLQLILGEAEAETLFTKLDQVQSGLQLLNSLGANSGTHIRKQLDGILDDLMSPGILGTVARGDLQLAPKQIIQAVTQQTPEAIVGRTDDILSEVATVLTQARGKEAEAALQLLDRARQGAKLSTPQAAFISKTYESIKSGIAGGINQGAKQQVIESDPVQQIYN